MLNRFSTVTLAQVAEAAGVSIATVSFVLNGRGRSLRIAPATREAVADWALRLGYQPNYAARSLRRRRSNVITLLVWRLSSAYFTEIAAGVQAAAERNNYEVNVVDAGPVDAEVRALRHVRTGASDGVIVATGYHTTRGPALKALRDLAQYGAPLVMLLDRSPDWRIPSIRIDDELGAYLATRHLVALGHRRIGHISVLGGRLRDNDGSPQFDRFHGYRRALDETDLNADPNSVVQGVGLMAGGRDSALVLLGRFPDPRQRPTALFVYNDLAAVGVLRGLYEAGIRVPQDMAIVGFHGLEVGQFTTPALTSITHARAELGDLGATRLIERIADPKVIPSAAKHPAYASDPSPLQTPASRAQDEILPVELLIRESCGGGNLR